MTARRKPRLSTAPPSTASLYLRLSRASSDEGTGLTTQEADLRALAARHGLTVVAVHTDDGESGALRNRPGLLAWLADARNARTDHLLAWKIDRVSRGGAAGLAEFLDTLTGVDRDGEPVSSPVRFISTDGLDSASSAWDVQVAVMAALAKGERDATRSRIMRAQAERRLQGRWNGGTVPYGFAVVPNPDGDGKVLAVDETEADAIREAARRVLSGESLTRAARWLTAHGPATRYGKAWTRTTLLQVLTHDRLRDVLSASDRRALAARVAVRTPDPRKGRAHKVRYLLSGLLRCSGCGDVLQHGKRPSGGKRTEERTLRLYRCKSSAETGVCPSPVLVSADRLEAAVADLWLGGWGLLDETVVTRLADDHSAALTVAEDNVESARDAWLGAAKGVARAAATASLESAEDTLAALEAVTYSPLSILRPTGRTYGDVWHSGTVEDRNDLIAATVGSLTVARGRRGVRAFDPSRLVGPTAALLSDPSANDNAEAV